MADSVAQCVFGESLKNYREAARRDICGKASKNDRFEIERFLVTARRVLPDGEYRWFRLHHVIGGDFVLCASKFGLNYRKATQLDFRVREKVGKAIVAAKEAVNG